MLRLKSETDLHKLGLRLDAADPTNVVSLNSPTATIPLAMSASAGMQVPQIPASGNLEEGEFAHLPEPELWTVLKATDFEIKLLQKEITRKENLLTQLRWQRGHILIELKQRLGHGNFLRVLKEKSIPTQRVSEDMRIADHFPTKKAAGKMGINKALKAIKRSESSYGPYENCFATPEWIRKAIERDYGYPGLDVASSHGVHFGERCYTPKEDGLIQDWVRDCGGKPVWCNPPYNLTVLGLWVSYAYQQSQRGCTVICLLPYWRHYPWFQIVKDYAEVRLPGARVILNGFGPKAGKQCGNLPPREYESLIVIFRQRQRGFCSNWIDP